jgi:hypothetical protein
MRTSLVAIPGAVAAILNNAVHATDMPSAWNNIMTAKIKQKNPQLDDLVLPQPQCTDILCRNSHRLG